MTEPDGFGVQALPKKEGSGGKWGAEGEPAREWDGEPKWQVFPVPLSIHRPSAEVTACPNENTFA